MSLLYFVLLAGGIAATVVFLVLRAVHGGKRSLCAKAVAGLFFIATAFAATAHNSRFLSLGFWMIFGLILGMLGDVWLDLKWIYEKDQKHYLYSGFISFMAGHLCFVAAIYTSYEYKITDIIISVGISLFIAVIGILLEKPLKMTYGSFKPIVFIYTAVLSMTAASAAVAAVSTGFQSVWVVMTIGGVLFILSDLVLSGTYFSEGKNTKLNLIIIHILYYAAQFTLASSIIFIR